MRSFVLLSNSGEKGSKLESIGLRDLELKDVGEDDTNDDLGEKTTSHPVDNNRSYRSGAKDEVLCLEMTGRVTRCLTIIHSSWK